MASSPQHWRGKLTFLPGCSSFYKFRCQTFFFLLLPLPFAPRLRNSWTLRQQKWKGIKACCSFWEGERAPHELHVFGAVLARCTSVLALSRSSSNTTKAPEQHSLLQHACMASLTNILPLGARGARVCGLFCAASLIQRTLPTTATDVQVFCTVLSPDLLDQWTHSVGRCGSELDRERASCKTAARTETGHR